MKFILEIECDNAAFEDSLEYEIARLLNVAGKRLKAGDKAGTLYDYNGNHVGFWRIEL